MKFELLANHAVFVPFDLCTKHRQMTDAYRFKKGNAYLCRTIADTYADVYFAAEEEFRHEVFGDPICGGEQWDNRVKGLFAR